MAAPSTAPITTESTTTASVSSESLSTESVEPPAAEALPVLATNRELAGRTIGTMWRIRLFEEAVDELFARGLMHGTMHLSIGQEGSATGVCTAMRQGDYLTSTHRGTGTALPAAPTSTG